MALGNADIAPLRGTVADLLDTKGRGVYSLPPASTVYEAVAMMDERGIGALLVMEGDTLVGIVSERDYMRKIILVGRASKDTPVSTIMTAQVLTVDPSISLGECLSLVTERRIRHLPVVAAGKVVGLVSIGDLVRAVVAQQAETIKSLKSFISSDYPQ